MSSRVYTEQSPVFVTAPRDMVVAENSDVLFQCHVTGTPPPVVVWKKRDGQIPAERLVSLSLSLLFVGSVRVTVNII